MYLSSRSFRAWGLSESHRSASLTSEGSPAAHDAAPLAVQRVEKVAPPYAMLFELAYRRLMDGDIDGVGAFRGTIVAAARDASSTDSGMTAAERRLLTFAKKESKN